MYRRCTLEVELTYKRGEDGRVPAHLYVAGVEVSTEDYQGATSQWNRRSGGGSDGKREKGGKGADPDHPDHPAGSAPQNSHLSAAEVLSRDLDLLNSNSPSDAQKPPVAYALENDTLLEAPFGVWIPVHDMLGESIHPVEEYGIYDCETGELLWEDAATKSRRAFHPTAPLKPARRRTKATLGLYVLVGCPPPRLRAGIRGEYIPDYVYVTQVVN